MHYTRASPGGMWVVIPPSCYTRAMATITERLSLEEFLALPEEEPALEYEDGVVTQKAMPKAKHSRVQFGLAPIFEDATRSSGQFMAFTELRITFAGRSYVPDVSVFRTERVELDAEGEVANDVFEPPDVAVEVVSPGQSVTRLVARCLWYVANGVKAALLVDPEEHSVVLFAAGGVTAALNGEDIVDLGEAVPGLRLPAQQIFDALKPRSARGA